MDEHIGLQKQEIPKLSDQVRERIEVSEERRLDPQRLQVEDALTKLTELLDDWEAVWISPPWRSPEAIAADKSERPGRVRVLQDGTIIIGEGARTLRVVVATDQLPVFKVIDRQLHQRNRHRPS